MKSIKTVSLYFLNTTDIFYFIISDFIIFIFILCSFFKIYLFYGITVC